MDTKQNNKYAVKILQFGEGNFLRAFVDWMIQKTNAALNLNMGVVVVQPLATGMVEKLKEQNCKYHVILEGIKNGAAVREIQAVDCIVDAINPYSEYEQYKAYFLHPELEFVISNTTEAGISRLANVDVFAQPPVSYPAKMLALLHERFKHFKGDPNKGLSIICCELIENNATILKEIVLELAHENSLSPDFIWWINTSCSFCNSLVDRIVTGFPKDTIKSIQQELGSDDSMVVVGEYYHLWAIESDERTKAKLPFVDAGLNVLWLDELKTFRDKKVRVLNGAHTALVPVGLLFGYETVKQAFADKTIAHYIYQLIEKEVLPNIRGSKEELKKFADEILERFLNPYIKHYLKDISLNSISKWLTRNLPSLKDHFARTGTLPQRLTFSLAALLVLYSSENGVGFKANDTQSYIDVFQRIWSNTDLIDNKVKKILSVEEIWGSDLASFKELHEAVAANVTQILSVGIKEAIIQLEN